MNINYIQNLYSSSILESDDAPVEFSDIRDGAASRNENVTEDDEYTFSEKARFDLPEDVEDWQQKVNRVQLPSSVSDREVFNEHASNRSHYLDVPSS